MSEAESFKPKSRIKLWKIILITIFSLWLLGTIIEAVNPGESSSSTSTNAGQTESSATYDESWIPTGFTGYANDDNIAWRWGTKSETNCTYSSGSCWSVMVTTRDGCPSGIYAELAILDKSDVQIDYTNDTTTQVPAGTKAKLTFDTFNEEAETARLSELSCR